MTRETRNTDARTTQGDESQRSAGDSELMKAASEEERKRELMRARSAERRPELMDADGESK
jgi:hypothetical protein